MPKVRKEAVESAIQSRRKRWIFFVNVNKMRRPGRVEVMSPILQAAPCIGFREFLASESENYVAPFVP